MSKLDKFIEKANLIHQNKYDYSLVEYQSSHVKIIINCPVHGQFSQTPADHTHKKAGCRECAKINRKNTNLAKYGFDHPRKNKEVQDRQKLTNLAKYGFENAAKSDIVRNKRNATNLERYGNICTAQSPEIKEKIIMSMLEKYGVKHYTNREQAHITNLERYGVRHAAQSPIFRKKTIQTNLTRYGCHPRQTDEVKNKQKQTNMERYGVENPSQQHMVDTLSLISNFDYMYDEYISKGKTAQQIGRELGIGDTAIGRYLKKLEINIRKDHHSYISILWLDSIKEQENIYIQHNGNIGEFKIPGTRYKADGYCKETNTIYEFHGDYWHGNPNVYSPDTINDVVKKPMSELYANTIERENQIISLGYNLVVMWESDFWLTHL